MWAVARRLRAAGYAEVALPTFGYHLSGLDVHAPRAAAVLAGLAERHPDALVDLVTHSYGGVLARAALAEPGCPPIRRLVMLSPPNQGAAIAAQIRGLLPVHHLGWDPLRQLLPGVPTGLPTPTGTEVGVLTGGTGRRGYSPWLGADNDGKVCIDEARLAPVADFHIIPVRHSMMPYSAASLSQILVFLEDGRFRRDETRLLSVAEPA
jgi:pimeloyl-ACP methyl ester carboxylesterase